MIGGSSFFISKIALVLLVFNVLNSNAVDLPNTVPQSFLNGEIIPIQVNVLTSVRTHLPYDYYKHFPTCQPKNPLGGKRGNIGGVLLGDRIQTSPYEDVRMLENVTCRILCSRQILDKKQSDFLVNAIKAKYRIQLILDGLPIAEVNSKNEYVLGVPLGFTEGSSVFLNNHLHFDIKYTVDDAKVAHGGTEKKYRILSFLGRPYSFNHNLSTGLCEKTAPHLRPIYFPPLPATSENFVWSYSVSWIQSSENWYSRWDAYMNANKHNFHWYSVINSTFFVAFLAVVIAITIARVVRKDLMSVTGIELEDDAPESSGWKLLNRDVFRPPPYHWLLACFVGTGVQLIGMSFTVLLLASLGFFSPQSRGNLFTSVLVCFVFLGLYAGYTSARLLKLWNVAKWKYVFATGTLVPGMTVLTFLIINLLVWSQSSSAAVPVLSVIVVLAMWFFISLPLVFTGAILGFKREPITVSSTYNQIPRHIPAQPWYTSNLCIFLSGFPPFAAVFIEVYFLLGALWLDRYYYIFSFLLLVLVILLLTTSEIAVIMAYFSLCAEDYRWWWRSFFLGASSGMFILMYSVFYIAVGNLQLDGLVPSILYLGYMTLLSFLFSVATGSVGFLSCFWFVRYIYRFLKVD